MRSDSTFKVLSLAGVLGLGLAVFILVRDAERPPGGESVPVPDSREDPTDWNPATGGEAEGTRPQAEPGPAEKGTNPSAPGPAKGEGDREEVSEGPRRHDDGVAQLEVKLLETSRRVSELEASLAEAVSQISSLESKVTELEAILRRTQRPVKEVVKPKMTEFMPTGEVVDDNPVFKATRDGYWTALGLDTSAHPEIYSYRVKWFNGKWSPWYFPGIEDVDHKTNRDGSQRRMWSYFTDHEFQVIYR
ncbi:MAG: hypothetical protein ACYTFG_15465 [Planctomycetota bacterium]